MFIDAQTLFSDEQDVTAAAASTNYIDLGPLGAQNAVLDTAGATVNANGYRDIGTGENLYVVVVCDVAMTDASSDSTLAVTIRTDTTTTFTPDATVQTVGTFAATSAIGTTLVAKLDPAVTWYQYVQLYYTPANGNLSAGSFTAFLTHNIDAQRLYAPGYTNG